MFLDLFLISARYSLCCQALRLCSALSYRGICFCHHTGNTGRVAPFWHRTRLALQPLAALWYYRGGQKIITSLYNRHILTCHLASQIPSYLPFLGKQFGSRWHSCLALKKSILMYLSTEIGPCPCLRLLFPLQNSSNYFTRPVPCHSTICLHFSCLLHSFVSGLDSLESQTKVFFPLIT